MLIGFVAESVIAFSGIPMALGPPEDNTAITTPNAAQG
jgi:hypothetical protein